MPSYPRIMTVDPLWAVSRMARAAIDLMDQPVVQVDVPNGHEALQELGRGEYRLLVTALHIDQQMKGFELALRAKQVSPDTAVVILADDSDPEALDDETQAESPFVYLRRPVDVHQFLRTIRTALDGGDIVAASSASASGVAAAISGATSMETWGPVPSLDVRAAQTIVDSLRVDVGAMAVVLSSRSGDLLLERGSVASLDREGLIRALLPTVSTLMAMSDVVGGHPAALQFFDGDTYDVFVLSLGFHHFLSLVFDGQAGTRQFGAVTRFGRRAAEDLKALLGASAYQIQQPAASVARPNERRNERTVELTSSPSPDVVEPTAVKAETWAAEPEVVHDEEPLLKPIEDFDPSIFETLGSLDSSLADDLFDLDRLAEIASESRQGRGPLSYDEARELGIVP